VAAVAATPGEGASSMVFAQALLLRCGGEADRGRFQERILALTAAVVDFVADPMAAAPAESRAAAADERRRLAWASGMPPAWAVRLTSAGVLGRLGLVRCVMEIFERLDFVDELIDCDTLLGNADVAEALVRTRLAAADGGDPRVTAGRPRLLCVLGDVTRSALCYQLAWRESRGRSARAQRALDAAAAVDGRHGDAAGYWAAALGVNAFQPDAWFALGVAHLSLGGGGRPPPPAPSPAASGSSPRMGRRGTTWGAPSSSVGPWGGQLAAETAAAITTATARWAIGRPAARGLCRGRR